MKEIFSISRIGFGHEEPSASDSSPRSGPRRLPLPWLLHASRLSVRFFRFLVIGSSSPIRVMDEEEHLRRRRVAKAAGIIVLCALGGVVAVGWRQRVKAVRGQRISALVERSEYAIRESRLLSSVDLVRARGLLDEHIRAVEDALSETKDAPSRRTLSSALEELDDVIDEVSRIHRVVSSPYLDLSLIRDGTTGAAMDLVGDTLFVFDRDHAVILSISAVARAGSVVAGGQDLAGARSFAVAPDAVEATFDVVYVLTGDAVVAVDERGGSPRRIAGSDDQWQDARFISTYGGNVYVLDQGASELYKYAGDAEGIRQRWLAPGVTADLSQAMDLAIDGRVWVLGRDGTVTRFDRGDRTRFRIQPIDEFSGVASFAIPLVGTRIWVLDRAGGRVVAFDRESGAAVGQWVSDVLSDAVDIAVNEEREMLYILTRDAVSTVSLAEEP